MLRVLRLSFLLLLSGIVFTAPPISAQSGSGSVSTVEERDGRHDFDFWVGTWKCHCRRLVNPLTGSSEWMEFEATNVTRPLLNGKGWMDEYDANRPTGHVEGLTIGLYDARANQWSLYWWNPASGPMGEPILGRFRDGQGEFLQDDTLEGKKIRVRNLWINPKPGVVRWEQAYSFDEGKTWETNGVSDWIRQ